jgi:hypothetical protein
MRKGLALIITTAALVTGLTLPAGSSARNEFGCPDGMVPMATAFTTRDKDKNEDGVVCAKPTDPTKAQTDNKTPMFQDGVWFYLEDVADNSEE